MDADAERARAREQRANAERARAHARRMAGDLALIARAQATMYEARERMHLALANAADSRAAGDEDCASMHLADAEVQREKAEAAEARAEAARVRAARRALGGRDDWAPEQA